MISKLVPIDTPDFNRMHCLPSPNCLRRGARAKSHDSEKANRIAVAATCLISPGFETHTRSGFAAALRPAVDAGEGFVQSFRVTSSSSRRFALGARVHAETKAHIPCLQLKHLPSISRPLAVEVVILKQLHLAQPC
jgi:hypothetical protein